MVTPFEESIAKLAWLSPHTHSKLGWEKTRIRTLVQIFPLIGSYYLFKKNNNGDIVIETILDELEHIELPENFFERIEKEKILMVIKKNNSGLENNKNNAVDSFYINSLKKNNVPGNLEWKGFENDFDGDLFIDQDSYNIFVSDKFNLIVSVEILHFDYILKEIENLTDEDKLVFSQCLSYISNNFNTNASSRSLSMSIIGYDFRYGSSITEFCLFYLKLMLSKCLQKE